MRYLVTTDQFSGPLPSPDQMGPLIERVASSLEKLNQLLRDGKIVAGGIPAGQKKLVFIVEADSNDEVTDLVHSLPMWLAHKWKITPLESWDHHLDFVRSMKP